MGTVLVILPSDSEEPDAYSPIRLLRALLTTGMGELLGLSPPATLLSASHSASLNWSWSLPLSPLDAAASLKAAKPKQHTKCWCNYTFTTVTNVTLLTCAWECKKLYVQAVILFVTDLQLWWSPASASCGRVSLCMGKGSGMKTSAFAAASTPSSKAWQIETKYCIKWILTFCIILFSLHQPVYITGCEKRKEQYVFTAVRFIWQSFTLRHCVSLTAVRSV